MQLYQNQSGEKESFCNIGSNYFLNDNLDILLMPKLASFILFSRTFITFDIQKPIFSKINLQNVLRNKTLPISQKDTKVWQDTK